MNAIRLIAATLVWFASSVEIYAQGTAPLFDSSRLLGDLTTRITNVLDFDGDGDFDALSLWPRNTPNSQATTVTVSGWENDGAGNLGQVWSIPIGNQLVVRSYAATADFDGDGMEDFVVARPPFLSLFRCRGNLSPTLWATVPMVGIPKGLFTSDVDGNGRKDIVWWADDTLSVTLIQLNGVGTTASVPAPPTVPGTNFTLFEAEVNGDQFPDAAMAIHSVAGGSWLYRFTITNGVPSSGVGIALGSMTQRMPVAGDIDQDGDEDIVVFDPAGYRVARRTGPQSFSLEPLRPGGPATNLADIDADGDLDLLPSMTRGRRYGKPSDGQVRQYGVGLAGTGGLIPTLGNSGAMRAGLMCEKRVTGGLGGALGLWVLGTTELNSPLVGGTLLTAPQILVPIQLGGTPGQPGAGSWTLPWVVSPELAGAHLFEQAGIADPDAPMGISLTQGLEVQIGL